MKFQATIPSNLLAPHNIRSVGVPSMSASRQKQIEATSYLEIFGKEVMRLVSFQTFSH